MRTLLVFLMLASTPGFAQEPTIGDSVLEKLKSFVMPSECESDIKRGIQNTEISIAAAQKGDWDTSNKYSDEAFYAILRGRQSCEAEPDNLKKINALMANHWEIDGRLTCGYHAAETRKHFSLSRMAIEHFNDYDSSLFHINWAGYYANEAAQWCAHDPKKVKLFTSMRDDIYKLIEATERKIELDKTK